MRTHLTRLASVVAALLLLAALAGCSFRSSYFGYGGGYGGGHGHHDDCHDGYGSGYGSGYNSGSGHGYGNDVYCD